MSTELGFGDIVSFQNKDGAYMEAQGVLDNEIVIAKKAQRFEDTLFRICVRTRVSAAEELVEFDTDVAEKHGGRNPELSDSDKERLATLVRVKSKEAEMNLRAMEESWGLQVKYGEVVQFQHVSTGKWLTVQHAHTANVEPENFSVTLQQDAATESWFTLRPGSSFQKLGEAVCDTQDVIIESADNPDERLHVSRGPIVKRNTIKKLKEKKLGYQFCELNCSLDATFFKVCRFVEYAAPDKAIRIGDLIMLKDPHTKGHLCSHGVDVKLDTTSVLKKTLDSSFVWQVQGDDTTSDESALKVGGDLEWGLGFRLRHINTGRYLSVTVDESKAAKACDKSGKPQDDIQQALIAAKIHAEGGGEEKVDDSIVDISLDGGNDGFASRESIDLAQTKVNGSFSLVRLNDSEACLTQTTLVCDFVPGMNASDSERVTDKGVALLSHTTVGHKIIFAASETEIKEFGHDLSCTNSSEHALPIILTRLTNSDEEEIQAYVNDLAVGNSSVNLFEPFRHWLRVKVGEQKSGMDNAWVTTFTNQLEEHIEVVKDVMCTLLAFVVEDPLKIEDHNINPDATHQQLMREQGVLDLMLDILELCTQVTANMNGNVNGNGGGYPKVAKCISELEYEMFVFLRVCIMKAPAEQEQVADRFSVLLAYVGQNDVANDCVTVLLDNRKIQETKIGMNEMKAFIDLLRGGDLNASILDVLSSLCSCQGVPMEYSQTELAETLLQGGTNANLTASIKGPHKAGEHEQLLVEFVMNKESKSASGRRGSASDSIQLRFPGESALTRLPDLKGQKQKQTFFSSQIYLMAEICFDRNYKAIGILQEHISFETLCLAISDVTLDPQVRSGLVKLVTSLYVDCQPQQKHRIKNLSFCWSAIPNGKKQQLQSYSDATSGRTSGEGAARPGTPSRPKGRPTTPISNIQVAQKGLFEKLKVDISNELAKKDWSAFTEHAVGLLFKLIDFKFYHNTPADLQKVVETLLGRLSDQVDADCAASQSAAASAKRRSSMIDVDTQTGGIYMLSPAFKKFILTYLDALPFQVFIIGLVLAAVTMGLLVPEDLGDKQAREIFDWITYVVFFIELTLRMFAVGLKEFFFGKDNVYTLIDFVVVFLDTVFIIIAATSGGGGSGGVEKLARIFRLFRMLKLMKIQRALKVIKAAMNKPKDVPPWSLGERFRYPEGKMVSAMTQMVNVLKQATHIVHRYRLVSLLGALKNSHLSANRRTADSDMHTKSLRSTLPEIEIDPESTFSPDIFGQALREQQQLVVGNGAIDVHKICFNLILYESPILVQGAIELLMAFFGKGEQLLDDVVNVQLLMHPDLESAYAQLQAKLDYVSNMLDNYESFCSLSTDEDVATSAAVKQALEEVEDSCLDILSDSNQARLQEYMMGGTSMRAKCEAQTMLHNLYLADAYLKWRDNVLVTRQANHNNAIELQNSLSIRRCINSLLCAYVYLNKANQAQMFRHIEIFIEDLTLDIGAAGVITEILRENEELVKLLPSSLIPTVVGMIVQTGRDASLLDLLLVTQRIGQVPIRANQLGVTQHLTMPYSSPHTMYVNNDCAHQVYKDLMLTYTMSQLSGGKGDAVQKIGSSDVEHGNFGCIPSPGKAAPIAGAAAARQNALSVVMTNAAGTSAPPHCRPGVCNEFAHLEPELQYHIALSRLLASSADGAIHIVESKVQSLFSIDTILTALMSDSMIMDVKISLSRLFYDAVVEVQVPVPDLEINQSMWKYLATFPAILKEVDALFQNTQENKFFYPGATNERGGATRALVCYAFECIIPIITDFFKCYYDITKLDEVCKELADAGDDFDYEKLPSKLFHRVVDLYTSNPKHLPIGHRTALYQCTLELMSYQDRARRPGSPSSTGLKDFYNANSEDAKTQSEKQSASQAAGNMFAGVVGSVRTEVHIRNVHHARFPDVHDADQDRAVTPPGGGVHERSTLPTPERMAAAHGDTSDAQPKYAKLQDSFQTKVLVMRDQDPVQEKCKQDMLDLIDHLEAIPRKDAKLIADLRFEVLLEKLVRHTREQIHVDDDRKTLVPNATTCIWIIKLFRQMIESKWGFSIDERDEEGDDDSDEKVAFIQDSLDEAGATHLCLSLFAKGMDHEVKIEALKLLVALLYREGGNEKVQQTMFEALSDNNSEFFFSEVIITLDNMDQFYEDELKFEFDAEEDPDTPEDGTLLLRVLQLMCEGHFHDNQDIMRDQPNNKVSVNLLEAFVSHFSTTAKIRNRSGIHTSLAIADVMLEIVQGPCTGNQEYFALESEMLETLNRTMRLMNEPLPEDGSTDCVVEEQEELTECILRIIKALLEGQIKDHHGKNMIYERILSVVHLEMLSLMLNPPEPEFSDDLDDVEAMMDARTKAENAPLRPVQVEALVVIQTLMVYNKALKDDLDFSDSVAKKMGSEVVSVEVIWNGQLQKKQFKAPDLCKHLVKPTRDRLVKDVDRDNFDSQMADFIDRCGSVHCELQWQDFMGSMGMAKIFSVENQDRVTTFTYGINLIINLLYCCFMELPGKVPTTFYNETSKESYNQVNEEFVGVDAVYMNGEQDQSKMYKYYTSYHGADTALSEGSWWMDPGQVISDIPVWVRDPVQRGQCAEKGFVFDFTANDTWYICWSWDTKFVILCCNVIQIMMASFTLILFIVVRAPVAYKKTYQETSSTIVSFAMSVWETGYYLCYLPIAIVGMVFPVCNALLLLDIIKKNQNCANVIKAVTQNLKQLLVTVCLMCMVMFIFTFVFFDRYHDHFKFGECSTMLHCSLVMMNFGLRNGGGLADYVYDDSIGPVNELGGRYVADTLYFFVVGIVMLNIVFGIIIDTFSELRDEKNEKEEKTEEFCFICGIERNKFEQLGPGQFEEHTQPGGDHNMWSYLRFLIYIAEQDEDDDDGLESFIRESLSTNNLDWIPHGKAISLVHYEEDTETIEEVASRMVASMKDDFMHTLANIKSEAEEKHKAAMSQLNEATDRAEAAKGGGEEPRLSLMTMAKLKMRARATMSARGKASRQSVKIKK